jgi:iron complex transport system permease protein
MNFTRWAVLCGALVAAVVIGISLGAVSVSFVDVIRALAGTGDSAIRTIVQDIRLPRVVLAVVAGGALAASGATLQGVLRNPLAEPYLLGVSGGAAVGAVVLTTIVARLPGATTLGALVGATTAVFAVLALARAASGRFDSRILLMAGVIVGAFANAVIMVTLANRSPNAMRGALWWMMGSLGEASWHDLIWLLPIAVVCQAILLWRAHDVDALSLGEEAAAGVGVNVERAARALFLTASFLAAATVAAAGLIGFVGLIVPAFARSLGARRARAVLLASMLAGGGLLTLADTVARTVRAPAELPVGAVTALVGVPFFLLQLRRVR